jgi:hypothetical protein
VTAGTTLKAFNIWKFHTNINSSTITK